ncbi:MAG TPA: alpha/beta fold hydrolase [Chthoniobacterales bacterium]
MPVEETYHSDGAEFPYAAWRAKEEKARVYFLHGMGSAPREFAPLGEFLSAAGVSLFAPALRGQGLDPEIRRRGSEVDVVRILGDLEAFLDQTPAVCPLFVSGESLGALLAIAALADSPKLQARFRGAVLLCPVVELRQKTPAVIVELIRWLARVIPRASLHPGLFIHGKARAPKLTANTEYQQALAKAPFRLPQVCLGFYAGMARLMEGCLRAGPRIPRPLLVLGGRNDPYISPDQLTSWFNSVSQPGCRLRFLPRSYHLLLRDPDCAEVMEEIYSFLSGNSSLGNGAFEESR